MSTIIYALPNKMQDSYYKITGAPALARADLFLALSHHVTVALAPILARHFLMHVDNIQTHNY